MLSVGQTREAAPQTRPELTELSMFNWISPHQSQQVKEALQGGWEKQMWCLL